MLCFSIIAVSLSPPLEQGMRSNIADVVSVVAKVVPEKEPNCHLQYGYHVGQSFALLSDMEANSISQCVQTIIITATRVYVTLQNVSTMIGQGIESCLVMLQLMFRVMR